jgi:hypothetical protein
MLRSAMLSRVAIEPLTAGSIVAVCDCCPALQPLSAPETIRTQIGAAAQARGFNKFTMLSNRLEMAGQTVVYPRHTSILFSQGDRGVVRRV